MAASFDFEEFFYNKQCQLLYIDWYFGLFLMSCDFSQTYYPSVVKALFINLLFWWEGYYSNFKSLLTVNLTYN